MLKRVYKGKKEERGFTLIEVLLTLFGISMMMVIFMSFFSVSLDQSVAVEVDSDVIRSEKRLKAWLLKDIKENYIVDMGVADSSGNLIKNEEEEENGRLEGKVFKIIIEDEEDGEWVEKEIFYKNGSQGEDIVLFREEEDYRSKLGDKKIEKFVWDEEGRILEVTFDYGFAKTIKVKLKE